MPTVRGQNEVRRFLTSLPEQLERKVLRGAARAAAAIIAEEARERAIDDEVRDGVVISKVKHDGDRLVVKITVRRGFARSVGFWLEWGTEPHFIAVDDRQRKGRGIGRINQQLREAKGDASLVINGQFVGKTIHHPGARPHPFLRPALDAKEREAIAAAQSFITARVTRAGIIGSGEPGGET